MVLIGGAASLGCMAVYQAEGTRGQGYSDARLTDDTYQVFYTGDQFTRPDTREVFLLYRCAQLTTQQGYEHFVILQANTESRENVDSPRRTMSSSTVNGQNRSRSYALIKMFNGSQANVPVSFNAKQVMTHLRLQVYGERDIVRNTPSKKAGSQDAREVVREFH